MSTSDPSPQEPDSQLPPRHNPLPQTTGGTSRIPDQAELEAAQASANFIELKHRFRRFAFPATVAFLLWYFLYVLASVYAPDFMAIPVFGNLNIGLLAGLAQFVTTFGITFAYIRHANKNLDPLAGQIRAELEDAR